jgi:O-antigen/teichoic acid export membrane protein
VTARSLRAAAATWGRQPWALAASTWVRHRELLSNTFSLLATTGTTTALGFAFWAAAARLFSQQSVGYAAAALSAMTFLGTVGVLGLGTLLIGELPRRSHSRMGLIAAALLASGLGSLLLGIGFVIISPHFGSHFADANGSRGRDVLFCAGVVLTAMTQVFDQATIGLLRGGLQLSRNFTFAFTKMLGLILAAELLHSAFGLGIIESWVVCNAVSLIPIVLRLWYHREFTLPRPDWRTLVSLSRSVAAHNWLNLSIQVPVSAVTVIAASIVSPSANAAFYAAWTIANVLYVLPLHLSTVLFAVASADPQGIASKLRFALLVSLLFGLPGMAVLGFGAHFVLGMFGPGYARVGAAPMLLLVVGYIPVIPKVFYVAVCRALGRIPRAAAVLTTFAALEMAAAVIGGLRGGLVGLALGLLIVAVLEALVTTPVVVRTAFGSGRHRRGSPAIPAGAAAAVAQQPPTSGPERQRAAARSGPGQREARDREQQRAALGLLMSLASASYGASVQIGSVRVSPSENEVTARVHRGSIGAGGDGRSEA